MRQELVVVEKKSRPIAFRPHLVVEIMAGRKTVTRRPVQGAPLDATVHQWLTHERDWGVAFHGEGGEFRGSFRNPFGSPGDHLWVREAFRVRTEGGNGGAPIVVEYKADGARRVFDHPTPAQLEYLTTRWEKDYHQAKKAARFTSNDDYSDDVLKWTVPRFMPRFLSRVTVEITKRVGVERLQEITHGEIVREGMRTHDSDCRYDGVPGSEDAATCDSAFAEFKKTWEAIHGEPVRVETAVQGRWKQAPNPARWGANPWLWVVPFRKVA